MALTDPAFTMVSLLKIEFPSHTVRLCDGGRAVMGGEEYLSGHDVWGTIAAAEEIEDAMGDSAPGGGFSLMLAPDTPLSTIIDPALQTCRVRFWQGELDADMETVIDPELLADKLIDVPRWNPDEWVLDLDLMDRTEVFFLRSEGNVCSASWHQSVWPGERGFDNCTDTPGQVAWGVEGAPSGTVYRGNGGNGGGGGGGGGRGIQNDAPLQ
ncbi:hypothetical protein [Sphingopyxis sp.]|uniref:hypothetical protein n=1 Tax=Sphingopyxis sp. TaxID=1908224 RepID=UPI003F71CE7E